MRRCRPVAPSSSAAAWTKLSAIKAFTCICFLLVSICYRTTNAQESPPIDPKAVKQAVQFSQDNLEGTTAENEELLRKFRTGEIPALHEVATRMMKDKKYYGSGRNLLEGLATKTAEDNGYVPSQMALAFYHHDVAKDMEQALRYFEMAASSHHQAALYNTGRLYATHRKQWVPAMAYLQAAVNANNAETTTKKQSDETDEPHALTETCKEAHAKLSQMLGTATTELSFEDKADLFVFGSVHEFPDDSKAMTLWMEAMEQLVLAVQNRNVKIAEHPDGMALLLGDTDDEDDNENFMKHEKASIAKLFSIHQDHAEELSLLQTHLLLTQIVALLDDLAFYDENPKWFPLAGQYWETLSVSVYCYGNAASHVLQWGCFNHAVGQAMIYLRREKDKPSMERILQSAREHPVAATKWENTHQTPMVYQGSKRNGEKLTSQPWWHDLAPFPIAQAFHKEWYPQNGAAVRKQINKLVALEEKEDEQAEAEVDASGNADVKPSSPPASSLWKPVYGMVRVGSRVRQGDKLYETAAKATRGIMLESNTTAAHSFVTLFDGRNWSEEACGVVPLVCQFVKAYQSELCYSPRSSTEKNNNVAPEDVARACATTDVVTLTKLRKGTTVRTHNGQSNRLRLTMDACLQGCDNVETTIGGETSTGYESGNGGVTISDDSFSTRVVHRGKDDIVFLHALLQHPDV